MHEPLHVLPVAAGWAGALLTTGGYALVSRGRISARSKPFQLANVLGGCLLAVSAVSVAAWPSVAANGVWLVIGLAALLRRPKPVATLDGVTTVHCCEGNVAAPRRARIWSLVRPAPRTSSRRRRRTPRATTRSPR